MKAVKILLTAACAFCVNAAFAQTSIPGQSTVPADNSKVNTTTTGMQTPESNHSADNPDGSMNQGTMNSSGKMSKSDRMKHKGMKHKTSMSDGSGKMKTKM